MSPLSVPEPKQPAIRFSNGEALTYGALEAASCRVANWLRETGMPTGAQIAFLLENRLALVTLAWAAQRAGLYYTPIPTHLKADEADYIIKDSGALLVATSARFTSMLAPLRQTLSSVRHWLTVDTAEHGFQALAEVTQSQQHRPNGPEYEGSAMLYSSGTTGRPKGVRRPIMGTAFGEERISPMYRCHGMNSDTVLLSPAPLYHAAPLRSVQAVHRLGGQVVAMEKFDPEALLAAVEAYRVTHVQLVPTMLHRLLQLPQELRARYDLSSLRCIIHAAAPCPIATKRAAIDWLGPIVNEYYGGTEGVGITYITSEEWLAHPGSVGRAIIGELHIVGDDGQEAPPGESGLVYFANGPAFEYHNAPEKMAEVVNDKGWATLGDIGRVDADGYLYLIDRRSHTINSGGVNIYPQEIEDTLLTHPEVADAAVFGVPNAEFGEEVKAVIQLKRPCENETAMAAQLIEFCRGRISHLKCPRSIDFIESMPRSETGKLLKNTLKAPFWREAH